MSYVAQETCHSSGLIGQDKLTDTEFNSVATLVSGETGIKLPPVKRLMVEGRLRKRARFLGYESLSRYCHFLFEEQGLAQELDHVINAVTTNKTDFFREEEHFTILRQQLVPSLLGQRQSHSKPLLKLWSAASSNGAEAYTIAMVLADMAAENDNFQFSVLGTDISTDMVSAAKRAIYPTDMIAPVPYEMQKRYIMRGNTTSRKSEVRIVPELRRFAQFQRLNLMNEIYPVDKDVDVIFLRNVLIYFEKPVQEAVISRLLGHLRPGGFLILGHSESMIGSNLRLAQRAPGVFEKTSMKGLRHDK